jgi:hypothetical protein
LHHLPSARLVNRLNFADSARVGIVAWASVLTPEVRVIVSMDGR